MTPLPERFETDRLLLRPVKAADAPVIFTRYARDPDVARYMTWETHRTVDETEAYVADCVKARPDRDRSYAILRHGEDRPIGVFELRRSARFRLGFGYALAKDAWGHGFMTEALTHVVAWAMAQPAIFRIGDVCDTENIASARVMEKAGLRREGILRRWAVHPNLGPEPRDCFSYARVRDVVP